jgi:hypothetical protein
VTKPTAANSPADRSHLDSRLDLGVPARDAQLILGHSRLAVMLELYSHEDRQGHRDALTKISDAPAGLAKVENCRTVPRSAARAHASPGRGAEARSSLTNADSPDSRQGVIRQLGSGGSPRVSAAIHQRACQLVAKQRVSSCCHRTHRRTTEPTTRR